MLVISIYSFFQNVFKAFYFKVHLNLGLCGKELKTMLKKSFENIAGKDNMVSTLSAAISVALSSIWSSLKFQFSRVKAFSRPKNVRQVQIEIN